MRTLMKGLTGGKLPGNAGHGPNVPYGSRSLPRKKKGKGGGGSSNQFRLFGRNG